MVWGRQSLNLQRKAAPWSPPTPADSTTAPPGPRRPHDRSYDPVPGPGPKGKGDDGSGRERGGLPIPNPPSRRHRPLTLQRSDALRRPKACYGPTPRPSARETPPPSTPIVPALHDAAPVAGVPGPPGAHPPLSGRPTSSPGTRRREDSRSIVREILVVAQSRGWPSPAGPEKSLNGSGREGSDPAPPVDAPGPPVSKMVDPVSPNSEAEDTFTWGGCGGGASTGRGPTTSDEAVGACNICRSSPRRPGVSRESTIGATSPSRGVSRGPTARGRGRRPASTHRGLPPLLRPGRPDGPWRPHCDPAPHRRPQTSPRPRKSRRPPKSRPPPKSQPPHPGRPLIPPRRPPPRPTPRRPRPPRRPGPPRTLPRTDP